MEIGCHLPIQGECANRDALLEQPDPLAIA